MTRSILLAALVASTTAAAAPAAQGEKKVHPMVGEWAGPMRMELHSPNQPTQVGEQPFTLSLKGSPTSFGGSGKGDGCDLRAEPDGETAVKFPSGQVCRATKDGSPFVTTLRTGRMAIVDGHLMISLDFDIDNGGALVVRADLTR